MSVLSSIKESVQSIAEAISIAVCVEVEIVDNKLKILECTGAGKYQIGKKEGDGSLRGDHIYAKVIRMGKTQSITYDKPTASYIKDRKLGEICTPVILKGETIGVIGLVAFTEEQRNILLDKKEDMIVFAEKMADLLSAKVDQSSSSVSDEEPEDIMSTDDIIGTSDKIMVAKRQALITAKSNSTVLITGESGTGKEVFAKAIHYASSRKYKPFVTVNCGAIPENLLESELFGYEKGAFTGASEKGKVGKFELADGGTIFLDEIGDMPLQLQVKILHVLQNMKFDRVGGNKSICVDVRVVAATNKDLEKLIKEGTFREDLYYRLSVIPLSIPPLRERDGDIKLLMNHFLKKYSKLMNKDIRSFSPEVEKIYLNHDWAGNVRELENAVEYGTNMAFGNVIDVEAVPARILKKEKEMAKFKNLDKTLAQQVKCFEREIIMKKLEEYHGVKEAVAKELGLSRATLYRKLAEFDIN